MHSQEIKHGQIHDQHCQWNSAKWDSNYQFKIAVVSQGYSDLFELNGGPEPLNLKERDGLKAGKWRWRHAKHNKHPATGGRHTFYEPLVADTHYYYYQVSKGKISFYILPYQELFKKNPH